MTIRYPDAEWRPLGTQTQPKMKRHDIICLHTMVGSLTGTDTYFKANGYGGTESHFGVGHAGLVYQWQDLGYTADANGPGGNHRCISVETADYGEGSFGKWNTSGDNVPPWTDAQIEAIAGIIAFCCERFDIPCELVPDSKSTRRGIAYHRQGVPKTKGATASQTGGELWSTATGKVCPGAKRVAQIPRVIERARALMGHDDEEENELNADEKRMLKDIHTKTTLPLPLTGRPGPTTDDLYGHVLSGDAAARQSAELNRQVLAELRAIRTRLDALEKK